MTNELQDKGRVETLKEFGQAKQNIRKLLGLYLSYGLTEDCTRRIIDMIKPFLKIRITK